MTKRKSRKSSKSSKSSKSRKSSKGKPVLLNNLNLYTSTVKDLRKNPSFRKKFEEKCKEKGLQRYTTHKSIESKVESATKNELSDYCNCALDSLNDMRLNDIVDKGKNIKNALDDCVLKVHKSQKTRSLSKRRNKSTKSKSTKSKSTKSKSRK